MLCSTDSVDRCENCNPLRKKFAVPGMRIAIIWPRGIARIRVCGLL
jgi:hypothetical protein